MSQQSGFAHLASNYTNPWAEVSQSGWGQQPQQQPKPTPVFTGTSDQRLTSQAGLTDYQYQQDFKSGPQPSQWMQAMQAMQAKRQGGRKSSKKNMMKLSI